MTGFKMKVTPEIENLTEVCKEHSSLDLIGGRILGDGRHLTALWVRPGEDAVFQLFCQLKENWLFPL